MSTIEVKVPDIGDFKDVPVIEIFVKPGDVVAAEDSLLTLESDKATMDVPAPAAGTVREVHVKVGDKVSEGTRIVVLEAAGAAAAPQPAAAAAPSPQPSPAGGRGSASAGAPRRCPLPQRGRVAAPAGAPAYTGPVDVECQMLVLGAGPGGYSAAFRAADLGLKTVIVERYAQLGGVCLNVGCIPSKALLHVAAVMDEAESLAEHGIAFGAPHVDLAKLRGWKDKVVGKLTGGLAGMAKSRKVEVVRGVGQFLDAHHVEVEVTEGTGQAKSGAKKVVRFAQAIIAAGSQVVRLPFIPEDPRVLDSTSALDLASVPKRMLVIGGGIIGLEMGTVYSSLGARLDVVEMLDGLMPGADRDLVRVWEKVNKHRFDRMMLSTKTTAVVAKPDALWVTFDGPNAPKDPQPYDAVLMSVGRAPNGKKISAEKAGVAVTDRGFIPVDNQMRTNVAAHLRDRRRRRAADARAQGHARGPRRRGSRGRREVVLRRARDSVGRVHRSRDRVGRPDRGRRQGQGHQGRARASSRGPRRAAPSPTAATRATRSCCSTTRRTGSSAAASSARTRAT